MSIPSREEHTGEPIEPQHPGDCFNIDVATSGWSVLIRFSIDDTQHGPQHQGTQPLLTVDEARTLIDWLRQAITDAEKRHHQAE